MYYLSLLTSLPLSFLTGVVVAAASIAYLSLALWLVASRRLELPVMAGFQPPVSVLKPLCGAEPALYECLRSFCEQDYVALQIVFGVADSEDTAVPVVRRLIAEYPECDLTLVVDPAVHGTNLKVSNLINMLRAARHDIVVVSDSDTRVNVDCIAAVVAPLEDWSTGAVTCLYRGAPVGGLASAMGALYINDWCLSAAVVDAGMRDVSYCFGPVTALRRRALEAIGGFNALAFHLADDFLLGKLIDRAGYRVCLSPYLVDTIVAEDFRSLVRHELRWARTIRTVRPGEHFLSGVMQPLPVIAALLLPYPELGGWFIAGGAVVLRVLLHHLLQRRFAIPTRSRAWLLPIRECLCFAIWMASFLGTSVRWRQRDFAIGGGGTLIPRWVPAPETPAVS